MLWLVYSIFSQAFFATGNIQDKILRGKLSTSALFVAGGLASLLGVPFFLLSSYITSTGIALAAITGIVWWLAAVPYYHSLSIEEASRVVPLWLLQVPFTLALSLAFLKEGLTGSQYAALLLILAGSFAISTKKLRDVFRLSKALPFMALASFMVSASIVLSKYAYRTSDFWAVQAVMFLASFAAAAAYLLFADRKRRFFSEVRKCGRPVLLFWAARQLIATAAFVLMSLAILNGPPSLVVALSGLASFFVFIIASALSKLKPSLMHEDISWKSLLNKAVSIALISAGAALAVR